MKLNKHRKHRFSLRGFTLIELTIVISIIAIIMAIAVPRVGKTIIKSREAALKKNLHTMRETIDRFFADFKRYPASLEELVEKRYLRAIPEDPFTKSADTWEIEHSETGTYDVYDVKSGSDKLSSDETPYSEW